jgi:tight adherence protein B
MEIDVALDGVAGRLDSADLRWVIMAIRIQRETGGNLAEVLRNTVATMRERAYLRRQVRSLSAEGRLSAYILLALPIVVGGWLFYTNPTYMRPLYTTFFGIAMLCIAAVLIVIGAFWMRALIKVEA